MYFLDLSKAFDSLDKTILLNKLYYYRIRGNSHKWINSYLSERTQQLDYQYALSNVILQLAFRKDLF